MLTDSAAEGIRATKDVDAIVEAATLRQCYELEARLPALGFVRDIESDVICRWRHAATGVLFDLMPIDPAILGFSNRWYPEAARTAIRERLSDRVEIRRIAAPAFIATKLEAFVSRGRGDFLSSQLRSSVALLCMLTLAGCAYARRSGADTQSFRAERNREAGVLIAHATPSDLAAAGLLIAPDDSNAQQPLDLIERAQKLAPQRPDFVWVNLAICERFKCGARAQIAAHLQALDPDNGFAWASDLEGLPLSGSNAVTAVIARIGAARRMTIYWNQLEVMMVDALAVARPSQDLAMRGIYAIGMLAAEPIPPLLAISRACQLEQLDLPGRRAACEAMVARMEQSDTELTQSLALSLQERWWPAGSPQRAVLRAKRRQLDYLMTMSSRIRWWHMNHDMAVLIEAARSTDREEDVERAAIERQASQLAAVTLTYEIVYGT
ncbi:MAG: hypothetical protein WAU49_04735 [Steroidobacteraceae bacterium]